MSSPTPTAAPKPVNGMQLLPDPLVGEMSANKKPRLDLQQEKDVPSTLDLIKGASLLHSKQDYRKENLVTSTTSEKLSDSFKSSNGAEICDTVENSGDKSIALKNQLNSSRAVTTSPNELNKNADTLVFETLDELLEEPTSPKSDISASLEEALLNGDDDSMHEENEQSDNMSGSNTQEASMKSIHDQDALSNSKSHNSTNLSKNNYSSNSSWTAKASTTKDNSNSQLSQEKALNVAKNNQKSRSNSNSSNISNTRISSANNSQHSLSKSNDAVQPKSVLTFHDALKSLQKNSDNVYSRSTPSPLAPSVENSEPFTSDQSGTLTVLEPKAIQGTKRGSTEDSQDPVDLKRFRSKSIQKEISEEDLSAKVAQELEAEKTKKAFKNLRRIKRKDLEDLVIELFMEKVLYQHELGDQRDLCKRLEATMESSRRKAAQFHKEIEDLKKVTSRLEGEHAIRKGQVVAPVKVKRSVGIQATPNIIDRGLMHASTQSSTVKIISPSPYLPTLNQSLATASTKNSLPTQTVMLGLPSQNGQFSTILTNQPVTALQANPVNKTQPPMVVINPQVMNMAQPIHNNTISLPPGTRLIQAPTAQQNFSSQTKISPAVNAASLAVVPRNSSVIDLTDDDDASKSNRTPVSGVILQRPANVSSSQFVSLPTTSGNPSYLLVNNVQSTTRLMPANTVTTRTANLMTTTRIASTTPPTGRFIFGANVSKHPAPLPSSSPQQTAGISKKLPPVPMLKLSHKNNSIVLSWNMAKTDEHEAISSYQLYAYQEGTSPATPTLWKKVGSVKALELPMACTLTQFLSGHIYHFAVRAVDSKNRLGPFSEPRSIKLES